MGKSTAAHGTGSGRVRWTDEEVEFLKRGGGAIWVWKLEGNSEYVQVSQQKNER